MVAPCLGQFSAELLDFGTKSFDLLGGVGCCRWPLGDPSGEIDYVVHDLAYGQVK